MVLGLVARRYGVIYEAGEDYKADKAIEERMWAGMAKINALDDSLTSQQGSLRLHLHFFLKRTVETPEAHPATDKSHISSSVHM